MADQGWRSRFQGMGFSFPAAPASWFPAPVATPDQASLEAKKTPTVSFDPSAQPDVRVQAKAYRRRARPGTRPVDGQVVSAFDARPIFAIDFWASQTIGGISPESAAPTISISYVVPPAFRAILRRIRFAVGVPPPLTYLQRIWDINGSPISTTATLSVLVDGSPYNGMNGIGVGQFGNYDCYVLAEESSNIVAQLIATAGSLEGRIEIYGNLLLSTGSPLPYEPSAKQPYPVIVKAPK